MPLNKTCFSLLFVCAIGCVSQKALAQCGGGGSSGRTGFAVNNSTTNYSSMPYSPGSAYNNNSFDLSQNSQRQVLEMMYRNQLAQQMTLAQRGQQIASLRTDALRRQQMMVAARQSRAAKLNETGTKLVSKKSK